MEVLSAIFLVALYMIPAIIAGALFIKFGLTKPLEDFAKDKISKDGGRGICKSCRAKYER